jgi:cytochrome b involved in lipid metabolism
MSRLSTTLAKLIIVPLTLVLPLTACASDPASGPAPVVSTTQVAAADAGSTATNTELAAKKYTMATVKKHHTRSSCWTVVGKGVYNLTKWINKHPGGSKRILAMCGKNATKAFRAQHGTTGKAVKVLATYKIGVLA